MLKGEEELRDRIAEVLFQAIRHGVMTFEDVRGTPEEKMAKIYTYAHVGNGHCENPHEEWRKDLEGAEEALVAMGVAVPAPAPVEAVKEREG